MLNGSDEESGPLSSRRRRTSGKLSAMPGKSRADPIRPRRAERPEPRAQYNFTDPQSRIMKAGTGPQFEQAYNARAAVDEQMLIVGERVSAAANDKEELVPTVAAISPVVAEEVKAVLVGSGF